jgi:hypothetical protein
MAMFLADPFTGLDTNEVRHRIEMEGLLHIHQGAIGSSWASETPSSFRQMSLSG